MQAGEQVKKKKKKKKSTTKNQKGRVVFNYPHLGLFDGTYCTTTKHGRWKMEVDR